MGWVRNTEPKKHPIRRMSDPEGTNGEIVEFTANWKANVSDEVEESITEHYDFIEPTNNETENDEE